LLHRGLRIFRNDLDWPSEQTACRIYFFDREDHRVLHWLAIGIETTRQVMDAPNEDIRGRPRVTDEAGDNAIAADEAAAALRKSRLFMFTLALPGLLFILALLGL